MYYKYRDIIGFFVLGIILIDIGLRPNCQGIIYNSFIFEELQNILNKYNYLQSVSVIFGISLLLLSVYKIFKN